MIQKENCVVYEKKGNVLIVHVKGEIDHHGAVAVRTGIDERIIAERPNCVLLELSLVDFMDSSGLGLIMGRYALVKRCGGDFSVLDPSAAVMKMIKLAGMERIISIKKTKEKTK